MPFWTSIVIVLVFCFMVKERREGRRGILCKNKDDFNKCDLPENWDRVIDCNGNGGKGGN